MSSAPVVALEIGTSKVIALVGERREDGCVMITGVGEHPTTGVRKGEVADLENAAFCIREALASAEESSKVTIREVLVAVSGGHIDTVLNRGTVRIIDSKGEITEDDVDQVLDLAKAVNISPEREVLHTICQHFCIDDHERVVSPEGMEGSKLSMDMLVVHGVRNRLNNAVRAVRSLPMDVGDVAFSGLCSALSVLTPEQKRSGAVVIDLGGGTTDYLVYAGDVVSAAGVLGVGGDHITNDIALAFNIPMSQAERLKKKSGGALMDDVKASLRVSLPAEAGFPGRAVSVKLLNTVINARCDEMLETIRKRLDDSGLLHHMGAGVILTGGGAHMNRIAELTEKIFKLPCSIGKPRNISGLATTTEGPEYATCSGLIQYEFMTQEEDEEQSVTGWLKGLFGG
jgi:cell division protein FtsA